MTELPEPTTTPTSAGTTQSTPQQKPYWLYRFAAWVGIVAGIVFIVAVVFFSGAKLTHPGWYGHHHHHHDHSMMHRGHHHHGPRQGAPESGLGPGEVPPSIAPSPAPPGR